MASEGPYLNDYGRELAERGERSFRRRHIAPVLIVSGRAPSARKRGPTGGQTVTNRPTLHGLLNRVFPLVKAPHTPMGLVVVGRMDEGDVDVTIPDGSISKRHCAFAAYAGGAVITDCGSRNGTAVNGAKLSAATPVPLAGGETITLGRLQLTFETAAGFAELVGTLGAS